MSVIIIVGSGGGGHASVKFLGDNYHTFAADEKADAVAMLRTLVESVNERYGKCFDTERL